VGGQSAGGFNVLSLMASPLARDLFQGAISQSGSGHGISEPDQASAAAERFMQALRAQGDAPAQLPTLAAERILQAERASIRMGELNGMIDGECLLAHPCEVARQGGTREVRLMIGANRDETRLFGPADASRFSPREVEALAHYRAWHPGVSEVDLAGRFASDLLMGAPSALMAHQHAQGGGAVHAYRWDLPAPNGPFQGLAIHGIETPLVWDHAEALAFRHIDVPAHWYALARQAHQAWTGFITRGEPQAEGWPEWPRYTSEAPAYLCVDEPPRVQHWSGAEYALWRALLGRV
jgi:para-nitrobenzyl esterase